MNRIKNNIARLFRYIKPYRFKFWLSIVLTAFTSILYSLVPMIVGKGINELWNNTKAIREGVPGAAINFSYMTFIAVAILIAGVGSTFTEYFGNFFMAETVKGTVRDLRGSNKKKINRLPVEYFDARQQGTVLSVLTNDVDVIYNALQQTILRVTMSITTLVMTLIMIMIYSVPLGLLAMLLLSTTFFSSKKILSKSQQHYNEMQNTLAKLNGHIQESYTGFSVIKLYDKEDDTIEQFNEINNQLNTHGFKASFISGITSPVVSFITVLTYIVMIVLSGWMLITGGLMIGDMQALVQYVWQVSQPLSQITQLSGLAQAAIASTGRVMDFLDEEEEKNEDDLVKQFENDDINGDVEIDNISFSYNKKNPLIEDLSVDVESGQMVAIVGHTGAGKTTIINLLMRLYNIDSGSISIDGYNIYENNRKDVRSLFGMVLQDTWLYAGSIADNIRFGKLDATDDEVVEAAKLANVDHFIRTLPDGYNMMINKEASNISQGQKQLITIARALIADPKILILDEATSSVDTRLEILIQKAMKKAMVGRTSFVIAHRLSTIRDADLILVMENGTIVEKGTHNELIDRQGVYEELYNSQFAED